MKTFIWAALSILSFAGWAVSEESSYDLVIYGGTSSGLVAGFEALAMGKTVVVIEPTSRVGGLTTGGLGQTDIGNKQVIGGLSRTFYERISKHYSDPSAWNWQKREDYRDSGQTRTAKGEATMWTFEPSAALEVYQEWIEETGLEVVYEERLDREKGVKKEGARLVSITMESGRTFSGKIFLDTTYEGDLLAAAGVSYTVGRESIEKYGESLNGVQTKRARSHNFVDGVDPYRIAGDPDSGLLPFIDPDGPGEEGSADSRVQAYCFRMCLTDHPENRIPFHKPEGYQEEWYELLLRNFEAGENGMPWINSSMPNRKTDTNNRTGFSTDFIGQNYDYPEASYEEREKIVARHRLYQQGLMWTLANHPRVPGKIRHHIARWGMCKDEFESPTGWQQQLYVREARRMVSDFVMTQNHCQQREQVEDSIGMGAYTMDSHNVQRYVTQDGWVKNEGDVQVGGFPPYPISYQSLVPRAEEASNLLVPVCLSASHMAFGSIRMEPVFMVLGQTAAVAASLAIDEEVSVQEVPYEDLRKILLEKGQILEHEGSKGYRPSPGYTSLKSLKGIVIDDTKAEKEGEWVPTILTHGVHLGYLHDGNKGDGSCRAVFASELPKPGRYEVEVAYSTNENRATNVPVTIQFKGGEVTKRLNQKKPPESIGVFTSLGTYEFGSRASVVLTNEGTNGYVILDAVRFLPAE